jgi:hypothetical protein
MRACVRACVRVSEERARVQACACARTYVCAWLRESVSACVGVCVFGPDSLKAGDRITAHYKKNGVPLETDLQNSESKAQSKAQSKARKKREATLESIPDLRACVRVHARVV